MSGRYPKELKTTINYISEDFEQYVKKRNKSADLGESFLKYEFEEPDDLTLIEKTEWKK